MTIISITHHKPHLQSIHKAVVAIAILLIYLLLYFPVSTRGLLYQEMTTRLGSTPPSCHNKCNGCHPCMAAQVPTLPSHDNVLKQGLTKAATTTFYDPGNNRYSNYKPLGWKCRCGDHFYSP